MSPDGTTLATGSEDSKATAARLWAVASRRCVAILAWRGESVYSVCFSPCCDTLATCSPDGTFKQWRVADGQCVATLQLGGRTWSVALSPDGATLAAGLFNGTIELWSVASSAPPPSAATQRAATLSGHTFAVYSVA